MLNASPNLGILPLLTFFINILNQNLEFLEHRLIKKYNRPRLPLIFIIGQPRSGSTLFQQLVTQNFRIGYISNLQARFWKTPYIGARLISAIKPKQHYTDFFSEFGNTRGYWDPHEWGWFWRRALDIDFLSGVSNRHDNIKDRLSFIGKQFAGMETAYKAPLIFKNIYVYPHISDIANIFDNAVFLYIKRNNFYVANSILNARLKRFHDLSKWFGPRPSEFQNISCLPPIEQCVAQVYSIEKDLSHQLASVDNFRICEFRYEDICNDPQKVLYSFWLFIQSHGFKLEKNKKQIPTRLICYNSPASINPRYEKDLKANYDKYFGKGFRYLTTSGFVGVGN